MFQVDKKKCSGCRACLNVCPVEAIEMVDNKAEIDNEKCIECGRCAQVCAQDAVYSEVKQQENFPLQPVNKFPYSNFGVGRGMGRGMSRGKGRGLGRGPRDGRGGGRGGGGRRW